jgi:hypothetical protein
MSLFPQKADIRQREGDVRLVPKADVRHRRPVLVANNTGKGRSAAWRVCQQYDAGRHGVADQSMRRRTPTENGDPVGGPLAKLLPNQKREG